MALAQYDYSRFCPSCGKWDKDIDSQFGWCFDCISEHLPDYKECPDCHCLYSPSDRSQYCWRCKAERYYKKYADRIEELETEGYTNFRRIKRVIFFETQEKCCVCNKPLHSIPPNDNVYFFCMEHRRIRGAYRIRVRNGMNPDKALQEAKETLPEAI